MIIGTRLHHVPGSRSLGISDANCTSHDSQPVIVLREATLDEWYHDCINNGADVGFMQRQLVDMPGNARFYEVSLD